MKPWEKARDDQAKSGHPAEALFKAMGLGPALDMVKKLVESGMLDKIVKFADDMEAMQKQLEEIGYVLKRVEQRLSEDGDGRDAERNPGPGRHAGDTAMAGGVREGTDRPSSFADGAD